MRWIASKAHTKRTFLRSNCFQTLIWRERSSVTTLILDTQTIQFAAEAFRHHYWSFSKVLALTRKRRIYASLVSLLQSKQSKSFAACFGCEQSLVSAAEQFEHDDWLLMLNFILWLEQVLFKSTLTLWMLQLKLVPKLSQFVQVFVVLMFISLKYNILLRKFHITLIKWDI